MKPGRELDILVAENVMGWKFHVHGVGSFDSGHWEHPDGRVARIRSHINPLPYYSTDITAAWEVVEKLDLLENAQLGKNISGFWGVWGNDGSFSCGETPALAICLAALRAIEEK